MKIGKYIRSNLPKIYFFLISIKKKIASFNKPYYIYITDSLGGSFKTYIKERKLEDIKSNLSKRLDSESQKVVDIMSNRFLSYPDESVKVPIDENNKIEGGLLEVETKSNKEKIGLFLDEQSQKYKLGRQHISDSVFYFDHGLSLFSKKAHDYIKNEDFVDLGAYVGDSTIALSKYDYRKMYSVEISKRSIAAYLENVSNEGIDPAKFELINVAISAEDNLPNMELPDTGSAGFSLMRERGKYDHISIKQKTFDELVNQYSIRPKFVKVDIEGYAMHFVKGGLDSIKEHRPILSIAIYHNPIEFFEIKPLLEKELRNYSFCLRKMTSEVKDNHCHSEVILLAYPSELVDVISIV